MPYRIENNCVVHEDGSPVDGGCHDTHEEAATHLAALEANVTDAAKAGRVLSQANSSQIVNAVNQLIAVLGRAGVDINPPADAETPQEDAVETPASEDGHQPMKTADGEPVFALGSAIKAVGENRFGGHAV